MALDAGAEIGPTRRAVAEMAGDQAKQELASEVWRQMFGFLMQTAPRRGAVLARLGLTPNESRALYSLDAETGRAMSDLAASWRCDASTATWSVNRLERLGLAERRSHPTDRRVRLVFLTSLGVKTRRELLQGMFATPPELLAYTDEQLRTLRDLLAELPTVDVAQARDVGERRNVLS